MNIFKDFTGCSGLKISVEKSKLYLAGVSDRRRHEIISRFPFDTGQLPVRYLRLPLLTKRMTTSDYLPLLEKVRSKFSSWTALSYVGRLALINSVITSLFNFWIASFRLLSGCIKEVVKMTSTFLRSGPELNPN